MSATTFSLLDGDHWAENAPLAEAFREFDGRNPQVYAELVRLARGWAQRRGGTLGIGMLWEVMRWNLTLQMRTTTDEPFKLNNNHRSFYARKIMRHEHDLDGVFGIRGRNERCECGRCA